MKLFEIIKKRSDDLRTLEENISKMSLETQTTISVVIECLRLELKDLNCLNKENKDT